jgi:hypothetical protein
VLRDFRERWATMPSVIQNNTLQELWHVRSDSADQWSHCPIAPLNVLFHDILGVKPTAPGFTRCSIRPQLGDLEELDVTMQTVQGPIHFMAVPEEAGHTITLTLPSGCTADVEAKEPFVAEGGRTYTFAV